MNNINVINSRLEGFYKLSISQRIDKLSMILGLNEEEKNKLRNKGYFAEQTLDNFIENVIGSFNLPLGIACNFKINEKDYLIPMVIEEPSVVAAASNSAKIVRKLGGFISESNQSMMIGQIQLININNPSKIIQKILNNKEKILKIANDCDPKLIELGGGARDLTIKELDTKSGKMIRIHILVDVLDAMGANAVNTMVETIKPFIEEITKSKALLCIISNLATERIAKSKAVYDKELLGGEDIVDKIILAYHFALADPYRCATHNKGIMNGIIALTLATGNDTRAIEAGSHAFAAIKSKKESKYAPLSKFYKNEDGNLVGEIEIPLSLALVGGLTKKHPMVEINIKILGVKSAKELCEVAAAVGLAQNVAALRALVTEGIQKGHMKLHNRKR
jgi:hydroxymethylglutaryl-CoA reductase